MSAFAPGGTVPLIGFSESHGTSAPRICQPARWALDQNYTLFQFQAFMLELGHLHKSTQEDS